MTEMQERADAETMSEIRELAARKRHHLKRNQVDGSQPLSPVAAQMVLANLRKCEDRQVPLTVSAPVLAVSRPAPAAAAPQRAERKDDVPGLGAFKGIPAGYYATPSPKGGDVIDYWKVEKQAGGQWDGYSFARRVLGGHSRDDRKLRTEKLFGIPQRMALKAISDFGPEKAQELFADTLERCIDCSTPLTNKDSRDRKRGKDCYDKFIAGR